VVIWLYQYHVIVHPLGCRHCRRGDMPAATAFTWQTLLKNRSLALLPTSAVGYKLTFINRTGDWALNTYFW